MKGILKIFIISFTILLAACAVMAFVLLAPSADKPGPYPGQDFGLQLIPMGYPGPPSDPLPPSQVILIYPSMKITFYWYAPEAGYQSATGDFRIRQRGTDYIGNLTYSRSETWEYTKVAIYEGNVPAGADPCYPFWINSATLIDINFNIHQAANTPWLWIGCNMIRKNYLPTVTKQ